jgi:ribonuclease P protein component
MIDHIVDKEIFQEVLRAGVRSKSEHFTLHRLDAQLASNFNKSSANLQIGVVVPKRFAKKAVRRNAIKRQVYAIAKSLALRYPKEIHVIRLNKEYDKRKYLSPTSTNFKVDVQKELQTLYGKEANTC